MVDQTAEWYSCVRVKFDCYAETREAAIAAIEAMQGKALVAIHSLRSLPIPKYAKPCPDCGVPVGEVYMVRDDLWLQVNGRYEGRMCIACFERQLGRNLVAADLKLPQPLCNERILEKYARMRPEPPPPELADVPYDPTLGREFKL